MQVAERFYGYLTCRLLYLGRPFDGRCHIDANGDGVDLALDCKLVLSQPQVSYRSVDRFTAVHSSVHPDWDVDAAVLVIDAALSPVCSSKRFGEQ